MTEEEYRSEMRKAQDDYTKAWMQLKSTISNHSYKRKPELDEGPYKVWEMEIKDTVIIQPYTIQWNHHTWTFTDEKEAWLFADYWKLI
jgi:hypothetical protein